MDEMSGGVYLSDPDWRQETMTAPEQVKNPITDEQRAELDQAFERARKALAVIETYDQARVDLLCQAVAWAVARRCITRFCNRHSGLASGSIASAHSSMALNSG